jgi:hypothetical protein
LRIYCLVGVVVAIVACARDDRSPSASGAENTLPPRDRADSLLSRYLALAVERDHRSPGQFTGIYSDAENCVQELYGDAISSYWLARGRVIGYHPQYADTLRARLELVTVAAQEPNASSMYGSTVTARIRTDTLLLKLVPDSTRTTWQTCGQLSDGHDFGGYGQPENVMYVPATASRASLLRQVDSIRRERR